MRLDLIGCSSCDHPLSRGTEVGHWGFELTIVLRNIGVVILSFGAGDPQKVSGFVIHNLTKYTSNTLH